MALQPSLRAVQPWARNGGTPHTTLPLCTFGVGANGRLDKRAGASTAGRATNQWLVAKRTNTSTKKNKKNKGCVHDVQCLEYSRTNKEHQLTCYTRLRMKWRQEDWPAEGQSYLVLLMFNYLFSTFVSVFEFQIFYVISILWDTLFASLSLNDSAMLLQISSKKKQCFYRPSC